MECRGEQRFVESRDAVIAFFSVSSSWDGKAERDPLRPMRRASFWTKAMKGQGLCERSRW